MKSKEEDKDQKLSQKLSKIIYVVNQDTGPYRSIQSAINAAEPGSVIKIDPGLYQENLLITKPNLRYPFYPDSNPINLQERSLF